MAVVMAGAGGSAGQIQLSDASMDLGNNSSVDLNAGVQSAAGGQIILGGQDVSLTSYTGGDLNNINLSVPQDVGGQSMQVEKAVRLESGNAGQPVTIGRNSNRGGISRRGASF